MYCKSVLGGLVVGCTGVMVDCVGPPLTLGCGGYQG